MQRLYSGDNVFPYRLTVFRAFLSRLCHVRFEYVSNVTRDISETKMAFQTLATFTDIVQLNHYL